MSERKAEFSGHGAADPTDENAIHEAYTAYAEAFARDPAVAAAFWGQPALNVLPHQVRAFNTSAEVSDYYADALAHLKLRGYSHSRLKARRVEMLNSTTALYKATFTRIKADGTELEQSAATYLFHKSADGWKMFAAIATNVDKIAADNLGLDLAKSAAARGKTRRLRTPARRVI